jgi:hypothetical protein
MSKDKIIEKQRELIEELEYPKQSQDTVTIGVLKHEIEKLESEPESDKPSEIEKAPEDKPTDEIKDINFLKWYSGMEVSKIRCAYKRYLKESSYIEENPESLCKSCSLFPCKRNRDIHCTVLFCSEHLTKI